VLLLAGPPGWAALLVLSVALSDRPEVLSVEIPWTGPRLAFAM
jgi:hypothetical protein